MEMKRKIEITKDEEKSLEGYYGKYILREGDLMAEMIDQQLCLEYFLTSKFLNRLREYGLLFDSLDDAESARDKIISVLKSKKNG